MVELGIDLYLFRFITKFKSFIFVGHDMQVVFASRLLLFLLHDYLWKLFYPYLFTSLSAGNHMRFALNLFQLSNDNLNMIQ